MGEKTIFVFAFLGAASLVFQTLSAVLPVHSVSFFVMPLPLVKAAQLQSYLLEVKIPQGSNLFCSILDKVNPATCKGISEGWSLEDAKQRFCEPSMATVFPSLCTAVNSGFITGVMMIFVMILNFCLMSCAIYMFFDYIYRSKKQQYRLNGSMLFAVGTFLYCAAVVIYGCTTIMMLDDIGARGIMFLQANGGTGVSIGYLFMILSIVMQLIMLILTQRIGSSSELTQEDREELKMRKALEAQGNYGAAPQSAPAPHLQPEAQSSYQTYPVGPMGQYMPMQPPSGQYVPMPPPQMPAPQQSGLQAAW